MKLLRSIRALALAPGVALACLVAPAQAAEAPPDADLARTWTAAAVWLPEADGPRRAGPEALPDFLAAHPALSVVVFAHGCDGIGRIGERIGRFLAEAGHLVVAPDGFARRDKPVSCDPRIPRGGLHRGVLAWRQAELALAVERLRAMPALAEAPLAVMGHSEGGITAATAALPPVQARIIEGWTCHAGWPEYRGLNAPAVEPVLALVGAQDPWFAAPVLHGDCGLFMDDNDRSVVFGPPGYLAKRHWLSFDADVQALILDFLAEAFAPH